MNPSTTHAPAPAPTVAALRSLDPVALVERELADVRPALSDAPRGSCPLARRQWRAICDAYRTPDDALARRKLGLNLMLVACAYALLWASAQVHLALVVGPSILIALLMTQLFLMQHDMGHRAFFVSDTTNAWVGSVVGVLVATPFREWTRSHAHHHRNAGHLDRRVIGDIYTMTTDEWARAPWTLRWLYRAFRSPLTLLVVVPFYYMLLSQRVKGSVCPDFPRGKDLLSVVATNIGFAAGCLLLGTWLGWVPFLVSHAIVILVGGGIGVWLFTMGHDFDTAWYARDSEHYSFEDAALRGSSFCRMPRALAWLLCDVGYHHVHHLDVRIPCYRLRACHDEHPELFGQVPSITVRESLRGLFSLKLYDPATERMVPFPR